MPEKPQLTWTGIIGATILFAAIVFVPKVVLAFAAVVLAYQLEGIRKILAAWARREQFRGGR